MVLSPIAKSKRIKKKARVVANKKIKRKYVLKNKQQKTLNVKTKRKILKRRIVPQMPSPQPDAEEDMLVEE